MRKHDAIEHFGTQAKLAAAVGKTQPWVSALSDPLPFDVQVQLALLTKCRLMPDDATLEQLRQYVGAYSTIVRDDKMNRRKRLERV